MLGRTCTLDQASVGNNIFGSDILIRWRVSNHCLVGQLQILRNSTGHSSGESFHSQVHRGHREQMFRPCTPPHMVCVARILHERLYGLLNCSYHLFPSNYFRSACPCIGNRDSAVLCTVTPMKHLRVEDQTNCVVQGFRISRQ